jgi:hypothetical protein
MHFKIIILTIAAFLCGIKAGNCQKKIVIKPGLSINSGFNQIQNRLTAENSFESPTPNFTLTLNGRAEYYFNSRSFIDLTVKGSEANFSFGFGLKNTFAYKQLAAVELTQFNLGYNRFFKREKTWFKKFTANEILFKPKFGAGFGVTPNKNAGYYRTYLYQQYQSENTLSGINYSRLYTATPDKKIGLHVFGKIGFSIFRNKKELFDLLLEYNKGLINLTDVELQYNINGTNYRVLLGSKGTTLNLTVGFPITLLKFK